MGHTVCNFLVEKSFEVLCQYFLRFEIFTNPIPIIIPKKFFYFFARYFVDINLLFSSILLFETFDVYFIDSGVMKIERGPQPLQFWVYYDLF